MNAVVAALKEQQAELDALLAPLDADGWATPTPQCPGWTVHDVVLHMAQTDEAGTASAEDRMGGGPSGFNRAIEGGDTVDDLAGYMVEQERGRPDAELLDRWRTAAAAECAALAKRGAGDRVLWVSGELAARTLATTRLSETWIHTGDVADALGRPAAPTARLWHIARLAWRTLPYAFARAGATLSGPVAVSLTAPDGSAWEFVPDEPAATTVAGAAEEFCLVAARRREPSQTGLIATGSDAATVLDYVRTYA